MADPLAGLSPTSTPSPSVGVVNIGRLYTGVAEEPEVEVEGLFVENGRIRALATNSDVRGFHPELILDAKGTTVAPGLVDCHTHPQLGDWTSRHRILDWIDGYGRAGITSIVSQGACQLQGRPTTGPGAKLLAMFSAEAFRSYRPGGVRVFAGGVMLEPGLTRQDFIEMRDAGVTHVAEIGISAVSDPEVSAPMVAEARDAGLRITMHFGGPSLPGSRGMGLPEALALQPHVIAHANGGSTGRPDEELLGVIQETDAFLEGCFHGGLRQLLMLADTLQQRGELNRLILGSDTPTALGVVPQAILRLITWLVGQAGMDLGAALAAASGNTAAAFGFDLGVVRDDAPADLLVLDAPIGSAFPDATAALTAGDMPGIAQVLQGGRLMQGRAYNCPFPAREASVLS